MKKMEVTRAEDGFSLLEMVVAMGILIVLTVGGILSYNGVQQTAKDTAVESAAKAIHTAAKNYQNDNKSSTSAQRAADEYNASQSEKLPDGRPMMFASIEERDDSGLRVTVVYGDNEAIHTLDVDGSTGSTPGTGGDTGGSTPTPTPGDGGTTPENPENPGDPTDPDPDAGDGDGNEVEPPLPVIRDSVASFTYKCSRDTTGRLPIINLEDGTTVNVYGTDGSSRRVSYRNAENVVTTEPSRTGTGVIFSETQVQGHGDVIAATNVPEPITLRSNVTYEVIVDGMFGAIDTYVESKDAPTLRDCLVHVNDFSDNITHIHQFAGNNLTAVPVELPRNIENLNGAFHSASVLNDPDMSNWNTSNVTSMVSTFERASTFNQDISTWDTSNVTDMSRMFHRASNFNKPLNTWDTSQVKDMNRMFMNALRFDQPLNNWKLGDVVSTSLMFNDTPFNQPIGNWNVSNVTDMSGMFNCTHYFNQNINDWDVSKVTDMTDMFMDAEKFNQPLDKWNTGNVTNMFHMFHGAYVFNQNINSWDVSNVTMMDGMFDSAYAFNQPLNDWDVSSVTDIEHMFEDTKSFNQPLNKWNTSNIENMYEAFQRAQAFNQDISSWNTSKVNDMAYMFNNAKAFNRNISGWNVSNVRWWGNFRTGSPLSYSNTPSKFR
jgi:surface protein